MIYTHVYARGDDAECAAEVPIIEHDMDPLPETPPPGWTGTKRPYVLLDSGITTKEDALKAAEAMAKSLRLDACEQALDRSTFALMVLAARLQDGELKEAIERQIEENRAVVPRAGDTDLSGL